MLSRLKEFFALRSVRRKLMAASIACIILPSVITLSIYNYLTQDAVRKQAVYNSQESLMLVNGYVTNQLKSMLSIANYVQANTDMNLYFKLLVSGQAGTGALDPYTRFTDESRIRTQLDNLAVATIGEKPYVTILLQDGSSFTSYPTDEYNPLNFRKESWFKDVEKIQGFQSYWITTAPTVFASERAASPYQISVVRTMRSANNSEMYGLVIITIMESEINQIFERVADKEEVMMLDSSNRILSHRDASKIGETAAFAQFADPSQTSAIVPIQNENYLVTEQPLSLPGWKLVSRQPYKSAIVNINSIFNNVFLFQLASFLLFLLLLLYLLRKFTTPLVQLGKAVATVQRGNLDVRTGIRGQDEIGRLGYSFDQMLDKVKVMIAEVSLTQARKRKAELAMLQAQINPHFLFNVLNSIRMKVMYRGDQESADMIGTLSKLLRMTIGQDKDDIPLHEEIDLVTDYLKLMNMRQKEKVELHVEVASEALMIKVPRFCLQPVIENAMIHGLSRRAGTIWIEAKMEENALQLSVRDSGSGMNAAELRELQDKIVHSGADSSETTSAGYFSGIGLPNVFERMKMTFGDAFRMHVESDTGTGTAIVMSIPRKEDTYDV